VVAVSIGDRISAEIGDAVKDARTQVLGRMRDTCVIRRPGERIPDGRGGETVEMIQVYPGPDWGEDHPHSDGKCYVSYPGVAFESTSDSIGVTVVQGRVEVNIPIEPFIREGDVVTVTSSPDNPRLVDLQFRVASEVPRSQGARQKLLCEHNQRGVDNEDS